MMGRNRHSDGWSLLGTALALGLLVLLLWPLMALFASTSWSDLRAGAAHPAFTPALTLSLRTTLTSLGVVLLGGTPLAWWLSSTHTSLSRFTSVLVDLPIVVPPAVIGVALLQGYGRRGVLGPILEPLGITLPFTETAVVIAQVVVSAPFYIQAANAAFRKVDRDLLIVARTLGASPSRAYLRIAIPVALPGLVAGASLAWARGLGEFGATLLFAGNLTGTTQTMPLAIFSALESDVRVAVAFSLVLVAMGGALLVALRSAPGLLSRLRGGDPTAEVAP